MINYHEIDDLIQYGRGAAAAVLGQPYDVYRLGPSSTGSVLNAGNLALSGLPIVMVRNNSADVIEQTNVYDMLFTGTCDASLLRVGDVVVLQSGSYRDDGVMFTVGELRPDGANVFVRTEVEGNITRPWGDGDSEQFLGYTKYQGVSKKTEHPYTLKNGFYYIDQGSPAVIPFGFQPYKRLGPTPQVKHPTTTHRMEIFAYVPILPGLFIEPGDILSDQNGNRYQIHTVASYTVGLQGYQLIAQSLFT